jgi:tetratricopeptide (TPR) repeat protein
MSGQRIYYIWLWLMLAAVSVSGQPSRASSAASYLERGAAWMAKGEIERAIADYDLAITFDPRSAPAYYNRAVARENKGDLAWAVSDYDQAIRLNPRYADAYINRVIVRCKPGEFDAAINDFSRAIRMFNSRTILIDPFYNPQPDGRSRFTHAMSELAKRRGADFANVD